MDDAGRPRHRVHSPSRLLYRPGGALLVQSAQVEPRHPARRLAIHTAHPVSHPVSQPAHPARSSVCYIAPATSPSTNEDLLRSVLDARSTSSPHGMLDMVLLPGDASVDRRDSALPTSVLRLQAEYNFSICSLGSAMDLSAWTNTRLAQRQAVSLLLRFGDTALPALATPSVLHQEQPADVRACACHAVPLESGRGVGPALSSGVVGMQRRTRGRLSTCHCTLVLTVTVCISVCDSGSADRRLGLTAMAVGSVLGRCARLWRASTNCGVSVRGVAAVGTIGVSSGEARDGGCPGRQGLEPGLGDGLCLVEVHGWHALESDGSLWGARNKSSYDTNNLISCNG